MREIAQNFVCFFESPNFNTLVSHTSLSLTGWLNSRVLKLTFLALKMIVKSGLEFILKFTEPLQIYLLTCQANSALMGRFFATGQQQLWRGSVTFKMKNSRALFTIILNQNCKFQDSRFWSTYRMSPSWSGQQNRSWLFQKLSNLPILVHCAR